MFVNRLRDYCSRKHRVTILNPTNVKLDKLFYTNQTNQAIYQLSNINLHLEYLFYSIIAIV